MIPLLKPIFRGELAAYGETLQCALEPPLEAILLDDLISSPAELKEILQRSAQSLGCDSTDLRPTASAWSLAYTGALLVPFAAAATLLHHVFPMKADDIFLTFDENGRPQRWYIRTLGQPMVGAPTFQRYASLISGHLSPLFDTVHVVSRLPLKILWGNTARRLEAILHFALKTSGQEAAVTADIDALLKHDQWHGNTLIGSEAHPNPLFATQQQVTLVVNGIATPTTLHRQCCLNYRLPGRAYCGACPLGWEKPKRERGESDEQTNEKDLLSD